MTAILTNVAFGIAVIAIALWFLDWLFGRLFDAFWPPSAEAIAAREAEKRAKQATKEFNQRQRLRLRLRTSRFWNFRRRNECEQSMK